MQFLVTVLAATVFAQSAFAAALPAPAPGKSLVARGKGFEFNDRAAPLYCPSNPSERDVCGTYLSGQYTEIDTSIQVVEQLKIQIDAEIPDAHSLKLKIKTKLHHFHEKLHEIHEKLHAWRKHEEYKIQMFFRKIEHKTVDELREIHWALHESFIKIKAGIEYTIVALDNEVREKMIDTIEEIRSCLGRIEVALAEGLRVRLLVTASYEADVSVKQTVTQETWTSD